MTLVRYTLWLILCGAFAAICVSAAVILTIGEQTLLDYLIAAGLAYVAADLLPAIRLTPWSAAVKEAFDNPLPPR